MGKRRAKTPQGKSALLFTYPRGISAALALSAPVGLPIAKSSLEEAERKPMESVVFFRSGCQEAI
ncbi:hypothetical protein [Oceanobacillus oncorhynchi]|uniref:hypothetical protein n=1 Tax=Oceanobacillus oncorhynchi TaxID=545501 RepID=UPI0018684250|nr:hypothetical protein [Oceanobacillus oncorhynchi]